LRRFADHFRRIDNLELSQQLQTRCALLQNSSRSVEKDLKKRRFFEKSHILAGNARVINKTVESRGQKTRETQLGFTLGPNSSLLEECSIWLT